MAQTTHNKIQTTNNINRNLNYIY